MLCRGRTAERSRPAHAKCCSSAHSRKIDMAARYGGEEYSVVLEATDREGGRQLAERIRQEVQRLWFHNEKGPFQCTLSLRMATVPSTAAT